jgi:hypothetical protein
MEPADTSLVPADTVVMPADTVFVADTTLAGDTLATPDPVAPAEVAAPAPEAEEALADTTPPTPYTVISDRMFLRGGRYFTAAGTVEIIRD